MSLQLQVGLIIVVDALLTPESAIRFSGLYFKTQRVATEGEISGVSSALRQTLSALPVYSLLSLPEPGSVFLLVKM